MGNTSSEPSEDVEPSQHSTSVANPSGSYRWPENLYVESRDMATAAFLAYTFAYILDTARKVGLKGLEVDSTGHASKTNSKAALNRTFTPEEVIKIVEDNKDILYKHYPNEFESPALKQSLELLKERAAASKKKRPITLAEFDDKHQDKEMVYGVTKDDINKRITLCFRGTDNVLAMNTNWSTNLNFYKERADVPEVVRDKVSGDAIWFHSGFYSKSRVKETLFAQISSVSEPHLNSLAYHCW